MDAGQEVSEFQRMFATGVEYIHRSIIGQNEAVEYSLEYGRDRLEIHADAVAAGRRVLLVDDLLATGGTLSACGQLVKRLGATIVGMSVLIEIEALKGRDKLTGLGPLHSVVVC